MDRHDLVHGRCQGLGDVPRHEQEQALDGLDRRLVRAQHAGERGEEDQEREQRGEGGERHVAGDGEAVMLVQP